jgi:hypothetical protein
MENWFNHDNHEVYIKFCKQMENKTIDDLLNYHQKIEEESKYENIYLNNVNLIKPGRRVGNTTRLLNYYIEELFTKGEIVVKDHHNSYVISKVLFNKIIKRLEFEHNFIKNKHFSINYLSLEITLKK